MKSFVFRTFSPVIQLYWKTTWPWLVWLSWLEYHPITKGLQIQFQSEHIPRLWVRSLVRVLTIPGAGACGRQPKGVSLSHPRFFLSLSKQWKNVLRWGLKKKRKALLQRGSVGAAWSGRLKGCRFSSWPGIYPDFGFNPTSEDVWKGNRLMLSLSLSLPLPLSLKVMKKCIWWGLLKKQSG